MKILEITFRSRGRSKRQWDAVFKCGSSESNWLEALRVAWAMNAEIIGSKETA